MSTIQTNSITDAAGTGAPDFPNGVNAATALIVKVDETERMRIDASGNLGLGVTPSAWTRKALQIGDAAAAYVANGSGGATVIATNMFFDGANKYATTAAAARYSVGSGNHEWYIAPSGTAGNAITFTQAMTLDASGNLGIGTSSPTAGYRLDVFGQAQIGDGGGNADINFNASNTGRFLVAGTERMRIDASGNVLVGKTTSTGSRFEVERTDSDNAIADFKTNNASGDLLIRSSGGYVRVRATGTNEMAFLTAGTERMRIDSAGTLQFNSGYGSVATAFGCRAWVNFNGTGTVAIRASGNVSSITDLGTGAYRVNLATAMPDANYAVATSGEGYTLGDAGALQGPTTYSLSTSSFSLACGSNTNSRGGDWPTVSAAVFR